MKILTSTILALKKDYLLAFICTIFFTLAFGYVQANSIVQVSEDSYIRGNRYADTNYGSANILRAKKTSNDKYRRISFLKFDLSAYKSITSAKLYFYGKAQTNMEVSAYAVNNDSWNESTLTWDNAPSIGAKYGDVAVATSNQWYNLNLTSSIQNEVNNGNGIFSVALDDANALVRTITLYSKENGTNAAYLEIDGELKDSPNDSPSDSSRDVYLIIGQSNTAGRGAIEEQDEVALQGVDLFNGSNWEAATNPMNAYSTIRKDLSIQALSYAYTFGKTTHAVTGKQLGLVVNARGGTNIGQWTKGASDRFFEEAVEQVNAALAAGGTLKGILWHQGEANRNDSAYLNKLEQMIQDFRAAFGITNLPFIAGQLSQEREDNATFNEKLQTLPGLVTNTGYVSTANLGTTDLTHFNSNGQRVLGYRYASEILQMIYGYSLNSAKIRTNQDAYTRAGTNSNNTYGEETLVRIKNNGTSSSNTREGYLEFDLSDIDGQIIDAYINVYGQVQSGTGTIDIALYEIENSWNESTITHATAPSVGDLIDIFNFSGSSYTDRSFFVSESVEQSNNNLISFGLKAAEQGSEQFKFATNESASNLPYMVVDYLSLSNGLTVDNYDFTRKKVSSIEPTAATKKDNSQISIYPNPAERSIIIEGTTIGEQLWLTDMFGRRIQQITIEDQSTKLDVSKLSTGTYLIGNEKGVKKLIKL